MIVEVIMPKLGMYEDDVTLIDWIARTGDTVDIGDPLFVMETEKVETEIEAEDPGILVQAAPAGHSGPIGSVIGYLATTAEEYDELRARVGAP